MACVFLQPGCYMHHRRCPAAHAVSGCWCVLFCIHVGVVQLKSVNQSVNAVLQREEARTSLEATANLSSIDDHSYTPVHPATCLLCTQQSAHSTEHLHIAAHIPLLLPDRMHNSSATLTASTIAGPSNSRHDSRHAPTVIKTVCVTDTPCNGSCSDRL